MAGNVEAGKAEAGQRDASSAGASGGSPRSDALTGPERFSIFARSFLLQSAWNTRDMQNVGFCYAMLALERRFGDDRAGLGAFVRRHLALFNTNPALSTFAITAAAEAEVEGRPDEALDVKKALSGPLGMAGDALMWGAMRPLAALAAAAAFMLGLRWAPVLLLAVYNVPHVLLRSSGVAAGRPASERVRQVLGPRYRRATSAARGTLSFVAGLVAALGFRSGAVSPETLVIAGSYFVLTLLALRARVPVSAIGLAGVAGGMAIMYSRF